ncbi:MAG: ATP-binding protein [Bifidobacteriaceae bacterium]|jgi:predicted AAA+ superfamily ATPase|nr:ATP-binding protein [Bifidobacteriaceae bacterium]
MLIRERYLERLRPFYEAPGLVKVITGMRRCGKSVLLGQIADELRRSVPERRTIFLDFELADHLGIRGPEDLDAYVADRIDPAADGLHYVFLDEVQLVPGFEIGVNSLRARGDTSVFITGSNAHVLSGELATHLAGRYVQVRVWPFSFAESLELRGAPPQADGDQAALADYLEWGGLPQRFAFAGDGEARAYLRDVYDSVVLRDIVQRSGLRDVAALETIVEFAVENLGRSLSPASLTRYFKSRGRGISTETIYSHLRAMTGSLLFNRVRRFDVRGKAVMDTVDKYCATDLGILASKRVGAGPGPGDVVLNAVFVELAARGFEVYTGKTARGEVDLVAVKDGEPRYIQVAYLLATPEAVAREFGAFAPIKDNYPRFVISMDPLTKNRDGIVHLGLSEFLLHPPPALA